MLERFKKVRRFIKLISPAYPRIVVTGIRGKSSQVLLLENIIRLQGIRILGKITGDSPQFIKHGESLEIKRREDYPVLLDENIDVILQNGPFDSLVFENQAISPYTMKMFNNLIRPTHIIVTNMRRDHAEFLGASKEEVAKSFGVSLSHAKVVISGEQDPTLNSILERYCFGIGARFYATDVPSSLKDLPGIERIFIARKLMGLLSSETSRFQLITDDNISRLISGIALPLSVKKSAIGVEWFDAAKVNDIDSSHLMLSNVMEKNLGRNFTLLAYFRKDRPDRTKSFLQYFNEILPSNKISRLFLAGFGASYVFRKLKPELKTISRIIDSSEPIKGITSILFDVASRGEILVTLANAVDPFMREIRLILREPATPIESAHVTKERVLIK